MVTARGISTHPESRLPPNCPLLAMPPFPTSHGRVYDWETVLGHVVHGMVLSCPWYGIVCPLIPYVMYPNDVIDHVMSCHVMSCVIPYLCQVIPSCVLMIFLTMSCHVMSYLVMLMYPNDILDVMSCHVLMIPCHVTLSTMSCHVCLP